MSALHSSSKGSPLGGSASSKANLDKQISPFKTKVSVSNTKHTGATKGGTQPNNMYFKLLYCKPKLFYYIVYCSWLTFIIVIDSGSVNN